MEIVIFLVIMTGLSIPSGISLLRKGAKFRKWNQVPAVVKNRGAKYTTKLGGTQTTRYEIDITYEYKVGDKIYTSTNYTNTPVRRSEQDTLKKAEQIPDHIVVYVNPKDSTEAYYKVHSRRLGVFMIVFGVCCGFGLLLSLVK